jgi:UDP-glucose 4-epimerase
VVRLQDAAALTKLLENVDAVVHFAAYIAVGESTREPELYFANNVGGSLSLFEAMARAHVKRLVFSSTAAVYGEPPESPIPEDSPFAPVSPYGQSKAMVERVLADLDRYRGLRSVVLRYFNACGAEPEANLGERHDPETHLIPLLFRAAMTGEPVQIFGDDYPTPDGTCLRDYIHVGDLEVLRAVEEVSGRKVPYKIAPRRDGDSPSLVANSQKLQQALGWKPLRSDLHQIVRDAWNFFIKEQS